MGALALQVRVKRVGQAERAFLCPTLWLSKWDPGVGMGKGPWNLATKQSSSCKLRLSQVTPGQGQQENMSLFFRSTAPLKHVTLSLECLLLCDTLSLPETLCQLPTLQTVFVVKSLADSEK